FNSKTDVLKYSIQRIEMIDNATGKPILAEFSQNRCMLSISSLKSYFAYGLKEEGSDIFVATKKAMEIAGQLIEAEGYAAVCGLVVEAIERDCPFFFKGG